MLPAPCCPPCSQTPSAPAWATASPAARPSLRPELGRAELPASAAVACNGACLQAWTPALADVSIYKWLAPCSPAFLGPGIHLKVPAPSVTPPCAAFVLCARRRLVRRPRCLPCLRRACCVLPSPQPAAFCTPRLQGLPAVQCRLLHRRVPHGPLTCVPLLLFVYPRHACAVLSLPPCLCLPACPLACTTAAACKPPSLCYFAPEPQARQTCRRFGRWQQRRSGACKAGQPEGL